MDKYLRKHGWVLGFIILSLLVFTTVLAQQWAQVALLSNQSLNGVWVTASKNTDSPLEPSLKIFAVGNSGKIMSSDDGITWETQTVGIAHLNAVWGSSATNVFAVGNSGEILHYNGTTWNSEKISEAYTLNAVWGSSSNDVYAVGNTGNIFHYNGSQWVVQLKGDRILDLNGIWGSAVNDIFAVGNEGAIYHYDGTEWISQKFNTTSDLNAVWGSSSDDVYAVGDDGTVLHYNGTAWSKQTISAMSNYNLNGIWGTSSCNVYAVGEKENEIDGAVFHFDGSTWSETIYYGSAPGQPANQSIPPLHAVHGDSLRDIFTVGENSDNGFIMSFDPEDSGTPAVCSVRPINDAGDVLIDTSITANFNTVMDPSSITASTFTLSDGSDAVAGTVSYSNNTATFTPSEDLEKSITYTAKLSSGITDDLGVALGSDYTWTFTTGTDASDSDSGGCFIAASQPAR